MIPRNPRISFDDALPHCARDHAFAQITNAGSTSLPAVETYPNKVMRQAAQQIGAGPLGIIHAEFLFERIPDLLEGADERLVRLWQWHLAEEFEHRSVRYDVLRARRRQERRYRARFMRFALPRLLRVLSPHYDPRRCRPLRGATELCGEIEGAAATRA